MIQKPRTILIVDDDTAHRTMLKTLIREWGYDIREADDGETAIKAVKDEAFDIILMDIKMVRMSGLEALPYIKAFNPVIPVIIMTAYSSVETAVEALKSGAWDYLIKPLDFEKLKLTLKRALEHSGLIEENKRLRASLMDQFDRGRIIGQSPAIVRLTEVIAQVAPSEATVLISGESGTGKELVASAIHFNSPRKEGPLIKINCAAITDTLLESELFGHEKGAFTGADKRKEGKFVQANGGTLFLDEIGEMPLPMQAKLLRVLQEREITRVGGDSVIPVDVRMVAATNRDLATSVKNGEFREDLYYRLNVVDLNLPPLRDRRDDISLLASRFMASFAEKNKKNIKGFTPRAMDTLVRYDWPGNVRELMNMIERAVVLSRTEWLDEHDFSIRLTTEQQQYRIPTEIECPDEPLDEMEKRAIASMLERTGGNKSEASRRLGITRKTLHKKLREYGIAD
ncbi:sigma-54-dependent transcriptional regulator [Desulforegula conservatrix]|uniref:sigma-54-dependent transcriptional regulator n=1 Tax=Desulforegula conservatrix TaxID=153026 RepID=UPI00041D4F5D|nr:sigma-54 dependent transcriptional regulator [Desulforegula conservatrix]